MSNSCDPMDCSQPARLLCPWDSPGKNIGVGCPFLLQGIFLTQGSNLGPLHCRQILYQLSYKGSPSIDEKMRKMLYVYVYIYIYIHIHTHTHIHTMEYYSAMRKKEILPFSITWMDHEIIMLSEISQTNTVWYHLYVDF